MSEVALNIQLAGLSLKTPLIAASGTFGYGREYERFGWSQADWGAIVVKGTTLGPTPGNPPPRVAETPSGLLNAIGLQNPGVDAFIANELPRLLKQEYKVIVNISGHTAEEYGELASRLDGTGVAGLELNVSCPNVKAGGLIFGTDPGALAAVTRAVRRATTLPVIVKLSPNVTDIVPLAKAAEAEGADALSLINTLLGMAIDIKSRRPVLGNIFGGLSGPAVKPVALRMVWQGYQNVKLPLIGLGGIVSPEDAIEFLLAGATAVSLGTGIFRNPQLPRLITEGIRRYLVEEGFSSVSELTGLAHRS